MKVYRQVLSFAIVIAGIFILLITSVEIAAYGGFSYYEKEYEEYNVTEALNMEMSDIMYVTEEMMAYLRGNRDELTVITMVEGVEQDFFNEQDRLHMYDVQQLFIGGINLRYAALVILAVCLVLLVRTGEKWGKVLCRAYWIGLGGFIAVLGILVYLSSQNFSKYFTIFHQMFFSNDLWIFDPAEDYMIRMLPEGFFYDMASRIVLVFAVSLVVVFVISISAYRIIIRRGNK